MVDLFKNQKLLLSLKELANYQPAIKILGAEHHVNHLSFNPSGNRFLFLHLFWDKNGKRYQRLMTSNLAGKELCVLPLTENISHYTWESNTEILVTTSENRYFKWIDQSSSLRSDFRFFNMDGHPSYSPDNNYLITDTIPDKYLERELLLLDLRENNLYKILRHATPVKYLGEYRCDFHPRWDQKSQYVCFDSAHSGCRSMYILNTSDFIATNILES